MQPRGWLPRSARDTLAMGANTEQSLKQNMTDHSATRPSALESLVSEANTPEGMHFSENHLFEPSLDVNISQQDPPVQ